MRPGKNPIDRRVSVQAFEASRRFRQLPTGMQQAQPVRRPAQPGRGQDLSVLRRLAGIDRTEASLRSLEVDQRSRLRRVAPGGKVSEEGSPVRYDCSRGERRRTAPEVGDVVA
jgi:hypothetical protein